MEQINLLELKALQLSILRNVSDFCEKNNVRYFLIYGTLIGAIRHKGYIPWDDDIDIAMPRPDYERFMSVYRHQYYKTIDIFKDSGYGLASAKVYDNRTKIEMESYYLCSYGVYIDIFPIDGYKSKWQNEKASILQKLINIKKSRLCSKRNMSKNAAIALGKFFLFPFNQSCFVKKLDSLSRMADFEKSEYCNCFSSVDVKKEVFPRRVFEEHCYAEFEGEKFRIPIEYDLYLRQIYGDYMQLPPEEKRVSHHGMKAYWI